MRDRESERECEEENWGGLHYPMPIRNLNCFPMFAIA